MTRAETAPFRFFPLQVDRTRRLGRSLVRVTFTGEATKGFRSGGHDQSLSLFLPHPGQDAPVLPPLDTPDMYAILGAWRAMPHAERAVMRSYTVRAQRTAPDGTAEIDIDFAVHAGGGPACRWAETARPGDRVVVLGPAAADNTGVRFRPPTDADAALLWGDETALPAVAGILERLPAGFPVRVFLEVPHTEDRLELETAADATVSWLVRDEGAPSAVAAVAAAELPGSAPYVWLSGESGSVKALRRHFVRERGLDRRRVTFVGYWRKGLSEDALRDVPDETAEEARAE
ncbi:siderophore-interacting protein [Streptomyces sp. NPDC048718]|uniref:siderophore-interacting protein n=1 Tax=Streptomyces sp. NPDC048718 TaxID=3365587 RepID=UPI0037124601